MGKITIVVIIAFVFAFGIFLFNSYIGGVVEDTMLGVTAKVVQESPIDNSAKQAIKTTLSAVEILGVVGLIAGGYFLFNKYFG